MTVLDLLAEAGGPTENANLEEIMVVNISKANTNENSSQLFNLETFVEHPDFTTLPLVRVGDTVYVPDVSQSDWNIFMASVRDAVSIVSLVAIAGGL